MSRKLDLKRIFVPHVAGLPFQIKLDGSDDTFQPVFSSLDRAQAWLGSPPVAAVMQKDFDGQDVTVEVVSRVGDFCSVCLEQKVRVLLDAKAYSPARTDYNEIAEENGVLILLDAAR